jgi:hypothetical protein
MSRYYFHTLHGEPSRDEQGEELADPVQAQRVAVRILGEILRDATADFWNAGEFSLVCADGAGEVVVGLTACRLTPDAARVLRATPPAASGNG